MNKCKYLSIHNNGVLVHRCNHPERYRLDALNTINGKFCVEKELNQTCMIKPRKVDDSNLFEWEKCKYAATYENTNKTLECKCIHPGRCSLPIDGNDCVADGGTKVCSLRNPIDEGLITVSNIFEALETVRKANLKDYKETLDYIMYYYAKYREIKSKPKIIFLDVDGVLNSYSDRFSHNLSSDWHLMLLKKLVAKSGAKIVVSSSWRILKHLQDTLAIRLKEFDMDIYDFTPDLKDRTCRGDEIKKWLDLHEHSSFVILDDESDMGPYTHSNFVKTNPETGLVEKDIKEALLILNEDMLNDLSIGGIR